MATSAGVLGGLLALGPGSAGAAGVDAIQVVRVTPAGDTVEVLVAVPERFTGQAIPADAFSFDAGEGPARPISVTAVRPEQSAVAVVFDNRSVIPPADLLAAQGAAVELLRGAEVGTPFAVVATAAPAVLQAPTTDRSAVSKSISSTRIGGDGSLEDGVKAALGAVGRDAVAPVIALFTAGDGAAEAAALEASVAKAGGLLTVFDAAAARTTAGLIPAVDQLTGSVTGRYLVTLPNTGPRSATLDLRVGERSYQAEVDLPAPGGPPAAAGSSPPANGTPPVAETRPSAASLAPSGPISTPESSSGGGSASRLWVVLVAAGLALGIVGLVVLRRRRNARRHSAAVLAAVDHLSREPDQEEQAQAEQARGAAGAGAEEQAQEEQEEASVLEYEQADEAPVDTEEYPAEARDTRRRQRRSRTETEEHPAETEEDPAETEEHPAEEDPAETDDYEYADEALAEELESPEPEPESEAESEWEWEWESAPGVPAGAAMAFARSTVESRPASPPRWSDFPAIDDLLAWSGGGSRPGGRGWYRHRRPRCAPGGAGCLRPLGTTGGGCSSRAIDCAPSTRPSRRGFPATRPAGARSPMRPAAHQRRSATPAGASTGSG